MLKIFLRPIAKKEMRDAAQWYDLKSDNLGDDFLFEIDHTFSFLQEHPLSFPRTKFRFRKARLRRYPYCLYYFILKDRIVVGACLHSSRNAMSILQERT